MTGRLWLALLCACVALALGVAAALAAPPRVDGGFGDDGVTSTAFPPQAEYEQFWEIASTPEGGVVTRSSYYESTEVRHYGPDGSLIKAEPRLKNGAQIELRSPEAATPEGDRLVAVRSGAGLDAVSRYLSDGSPDTSFGTAGTSEKLPFEVQALAPLASGGALVAGEGVLEPGGARTPPTYQVYVVRLGADGKIDQGFGTGGIAKMESEDKAPGTEALHIQARGGSGAEVVLSSNVVGLDSAGKLDPSFGHGGLVTTPGPAIGGASAAGEAVVVEGTKSSSPPVEGKFEGPDDEFYSARYTNTGALDTTYAGGAGVGVLQVDGEAAAESSLFGSDGTGTIGGLVAGDAANCTPGYYCDGTPVVVRFGPEGLPVGGFGSDGIVRFSNFTVPIESEYGYGVVALAARPGGGVFASGDGPGLAFVAALGANGSLDAGFGNGGFVTKRGGTKPSRAIPVATAVDRAGDVYVLVDSNSGVNLAEASLVLRYLPDGALDLGYGEGGKAYVPRYSEGLAVAPDGSAYVSSSQEETVIGLTPSGALDPRFGKDGSASLPSGAHFQPSELKVLGDGDILAAGEAYPVSRPWPAVVRLRPDGEVVRSFGKDGLAAARPRRGYEWEGTTALLVDSRGRIVLAGNEFHSCCSERAALVRIGGRGHVDRSFGHGGSTLIGGRASATITGLAERGTHILAAATSSGSKKTRDLLYSFGSGGHLDRGFGDKGVAVAKPRDGSREIYESVAVFSVGRRIVIARSYPADPLVAFSSRGKLEPSFARRLEGLVPKRSKGSIRVAPAATLDGTGLIIAWEGTRTDGSGEPTKEGVLNLGSVLLGRPSRGHSRN